MNKLKVPSIPLHNPVHIGEVLREYREGITLKQLSNILGTNTLRQTYKILHRNAPVTEEMCLRLAYYFQTSFEFWHTLHTQYVLYNLSQIEVGLSEHISTLRQEYQITNETNPNM